MVFKMQMLISTCTFGWLLYITICVQLIDWWYELALISFVSTIFCFMICVY